MIAVFTIFLFAATSPVHAQQGDLARGVRLLRQDQHSEAIVALERAVQAQPRNPDAHFFLGAAYAGHAMEAGRARQALLAGRIRGSFQQALELDPDHLDARWGLMHFYLLAPRLLGGNTDAARRQAAEIRERSRYRGSMAWGTIHAHEGFHAAAEREFQQAMQIAPDSMPPVSALARMYQGNQQWDKAFALLERVARERPGEARVQFLLGRTARESGSRLEQGEKALRRYLLTRPGEGEPSLAQARVELGGILERRGDRAAARREFETALELEPGMREAREALRRVPS